MNISLSALALSLPARYIRFRPERRLGACRVGEGLEALEMAEQYQGSRCYCPHPPGDMWAFSLLLLDMVGGRRPALHEQAFQAGHSLQYSATLRTLRPRFSKQVRAGSSRRWQHCAVH